MDVDGTLTDGQIYYSSTGEEIKGFDVKDGYAIKNIAPLHEIQCAIITGRSSIALEKRCAELSIALVKQGITDKKTCLIELTTQLGLSLEEVAYIGDDLNDLDAMLICGVKGCPCDAVQKIRDIADFICQRNGGHGAVRDFIEHITHINAN